VHARVAIPVSLTDGDDDDDIAIVKLAWEWGAM
jgi:hypothetical protein